MSGTASKKARLVTQGTTSLMSGDPVYFYGGSTWENAGTVNLADGAEMLNEDSTDANAFTNDSGGTLAYTAST
ncbi:MAG TPA: hypothetical protein VG650_09335, partial [Mycobacteriales bacterium]|nr:hypothetical protein [Mycobacteriales bacterium]